ncbi:MAG: hypothetical protein SV422_03620 [Pseudomonadota bacterium]|nr:hypothetical protein [Pseudomonadota bacterium]
MLKNPAFRACFVTRSQYFERVCGKYFLSHPEILIRAVSKVSTSRDRAAEYTSQKHAAKKRRCRIGIALLQQNANQALAQFITLVASRAATATLAAAALLPALTLALFALAIAAATTALSTTTLSTTLCGAALAVAVIAGAAWRAFAFATLDFVAAALEGLAAAAVAVFIILFLTTRLPRRILTRRTAHTLSRAAATCGLACILLILIGLTLSGTSAGLARIRIRIIAGRAATAGAALIALLTGIVATLVVRLLIVFSCHDGLH